MKLALKLPLFFSLLAIAGCSESSSSPGPDRESKRLSIAKVWKTENSQCAVQGNPANWQGAYCMWLSKTNDFQQDEVQSCYKMLTGRAGIPKTVCERNAYFKREICKTLVVDSYGSNSLEECMRSDDYVPVAVREGL